MAFAPAFLPHHLPNLRSSLTQHLEPGLHSPSHALMPLPGMSLYNCNMISPFNAALGGLNSKGLELARHWNPTYQQQLPTLDSRNLISHIIGPGPPPFPFMPNKVSEFSCGTDRWNAYELNSKWRISSEISKYQEQQRASSLETENRYSSMDLTKIPTWTSKFASKDKTEKDINKLFGGISQVAASENATAELERDSSEDVVKISSFNMESSDIRGYISKSNRNETRQIRHSIREILKPRENSRVVANHMDEKRSALYGKRQMKKKNRHFSWMNARQPKSADVINSGESTKDLHRVKLKHKVISVFTMASSSFSQTLDRASPKSSRKSSSFDFLERTSTYSPGVSNLLDDQPVSPQALSLSRGQGDRKTFQCPQCRYLTDRKNNLKRHIVTMHQDSGKVLECCGVPFQSKAALRDHNTIFHRGGYRCQICARNFCRKALLRRHLTVHSGQKDFFCELCGYATSHKSNLERHQKVHSKRTTDSKTAIGRQDLSVMNGNLNCSQSERIREGNSPSFSDEVQVTMDFNEEEIALVNGTEAGTIHQSEEDFDVYAMSSGHFIREILSPSRSKGKKARFFTSRLEETYKESLNKTSSYSCSLNHISSDEDKNIEDIEDRSFEKAGSDSSHELHNNLTDNEEESLTNGSSVLKTVEEEKDYRKEVGTFEETDKRTDGDPEIKVETDDKFRNRQEDSSKSTSHICVNVREPNVEECLASESTYPNLANVRDSVARPHATLKKPRTILNNKHRMCPLFYECDDCGHNFQSQQELQAHLCPKTSLHGLLDISLVTALQKGCLKLPE